MWIENPLAVLVGANNTKAVEELPLHQKNWQIRRRVQWIQRLDAADVMLPIIGGDGDFFEKNFAKRRNDTLKIDGSRLNQLLKKCWLRSNNDKVAFYHPSGSNYKWRRLDAAPPDAEQRLAIASTQTFPPAASSAATSTAALPATSTAALPAARPAPQGILPPLDDRPSTGADAPAARPASSELLLFQLLCWCCLLQPLCALMGHGSRARAVCLDFPLCHSSCRGDSKVRYSRVAFSRSFRIVFASVYFGWCQLKRCPGSLSRSDLGLCQMRAIFQLYRRKKSIDTRHHSPPAMRRSRLRPARP